MGPIARNIENLWWVLLALGSAVYLLVLGLLVLPTFLRKRTARHTSETVEQSDVPPKMASRWIILGGVLLPVVLLTTALVLSVKTMRAIPQSAPRAGLRIDVIGYQWWWSVHYPEQDITVANEIHIPTGQHVELRVTSSDVIHSLWIPELAGKIDAIPDRINSLIVRADQPDEYRGRCAEFCGLEHAKMGILVVAQSPEEFAQWLEDQQLPAGDPSSAEAKAGEEIFLSAGCTGCHVVRGTTGASRERGPDLTHFASRRTLTAALISNSPEELSRWIRSPEMIKRETGMPATRLNSRQLAALLAYLQSLD